MTFGLQPTTLSDSLKDWSPDIYDVFTYHVQGKKSELRSNANQIVNVLFNKTLHVEHWSKVQFGTVQNFSARQNNTLTLVVLTWLRQLQQYFFDTTLNKSGDWSKMGKYCGMTTNPLKNTAPLANINFSKYSQQQVVEQITHVKQFKPLENREGFCTSLEEWALHILKPKEWFQLELLYDKDKDTKLRWNRVTEEVQPLFQIIDKNLSTTATNSGDIENNNLDSLNTSMKRQQGVSTNDLVATVNATLIDGLEKAEQQKKQERKKSSRELANRKRCLMPHL
jgi:hypothetical protein